MKKIFLLAIFLGFTLKIYAQGSLCNSATPFCAGSSAFTFPAGVDAGTGQTGPNYGCLGSTPNPAWYYMQVAQSGDINFEIHTTPQEDVDFICWGPFSSYTDPCVAQLTGSTPPLPSHHASGAGGGFPSLNTIDCSYNSSWQEWCYIPNGIAGEYYILLITNYSNEPCNISFSQTAGSGYTNCGILPPNTSNNGPICEGDTLKLTANYMPNAVYLWSGPNGWSSYVQNPKIPNATAAYSGTYTLNITIGSQLSPPTQTIAVVKPKPHLVPIADTICIGDTATIKVSGANSYLWTPGNFTTNTLKLAPTVTTNYKVVGTTNGCKDSVNTFIKVNPLPIVSVNNDTVCPNTIATLIAHGAYTYEWNNSIIGDSIMENPTAQETTYSVVGTDINNCIDTVTAKIVHWPLPTIQLTSNTTICAGSQATLTAEGGVSYSWNTTETTSSIVVSPTDSVTTYTVGVTDNNNCFDSASVKVTTIPLPLPFISNEMDTICKGTYTTITAGGGTSYLWNTGEVTPSISVKPLTPTIYTVTVKTSLNNIVCSKDTSIQQNIRNCNVIYVPNAFMPTGYNAVFKPIGDIAITKSYQFSIYNRWGQLVFETTDVNQGWDGRFNGEYVQSGAFIYYLKIDNGFEEPFEKIGTVTVVQ